MPSLLHHLLFKIPVVGKKLRRWYDASVRLEQLNIGDFTSPIASNETIKEFARIDLANRTPITDAESQLPSIKLNLEGQKRLLDEFTEKEWISANWINRYPVGNDFYQRLDAMMLHAMISRFRPAKIIEIGSGFSSLAILDSLEANQLLDTTVTLIEPNPERLLAHLSASDRDRFHLLTRPLENKDLKRVEELQGNDLLLVDSSHVYKVGSDVQRLFEVFYPALNPGVLLHIHDVFFPFDYPASWLRRGDHMNEAYVLRSFLQYNSEFEILLWNDFVKHASEITLPSGLDFGESDISTSIWLRRTDDAASQAATSRL